MINVKKFVLVLIGIMVMSICMLSVEANATNIKTITGNTNSSTTRIKSTSNSTENTENLAETTITEGTNASTVKTISSNTSSNYSNTNSNTSTNKSSLPYTGTKSTVVFVVIAFGISAAYAHRKVKEYKNI